MQKPPFKLASPMTNGAGSYAPVVCCEAPMTSQSSVEAVEHTAAASPARARLADLDLHLHCSVIGTCLGTAELRKLMARFVFVRDDSDLQVHHEAVAHAGRGGPIAKALQKLLDQRHEPVIRRFAQAHGTAALSTLWQEALRHGEVPGAYWAVLTHRDLSPELRQQVFGDVHMLSHLVGAANRADIRRLVALERENAELRDRGERQQQRTQELCDERDGSIALLQRQLAELAAEAQRAAAQAAAQAPGAFRMSGRFDLQADLHAATALVALQTERRERAEQAAEATQAEASRLRDELAHLGRHVQALNRELLAAETQLREIGDGPVAPSRALQGSLQGRRVFYVGGRPSSTPAIRSLVLRHGGEFQHHDGGLEDRKGLLASGVAWAQLVVFPVDCIDHDSAGNLKRLCARNGVVYLPLRGASVTSFAAALANPRGDEPAPSPD